MMAGETNILWPGLVTWFAKSSGPTADKSKFIPVSPEALEECHYKGGKDMLSIYCNNYPDTLLFDANEKFESGTGWPSFTSPLEDNVINYIEDNSHGMSRVETTCSTCDAHLGHVSSNLAGLWSIEPSGTDSRTGRPTYRTQQMGLDSMDRTIPNQIHRDFEAKAIRSLREGNWAAQEPGATTEEENPLDPGRPANDPQMGGSALFGNLTGIASVVDISESDEEMEGDSQAQDAPLGPEAQSWENFRTLAMEDDARLGMERPVEILEQADADVD